MCIRPCVDVSPADNFWSSLYEMMEGKASDTARGATRGNDEASTRHQFLIDCGLARRASAEASLGVGELLSISVHPHVERMALTMWSNDAKKTNVTKATAAAE
ncbi:hypothetical protein EON64_17195, partial [archaeon]